jgi:hypothetical protein
MRTEASYFTAEGCAHVEIGQHFDVPGKGRGYATKLGRRWVEVLIYG